MVEQGQAYQTTVEILKAEDLTTAEVLETLSEADILSLKLTLGQRNLLKKEVEKLKRRNAKASSDNTDSGEAMDLGDESEQSSTPDLPSSAHGENETVNDRNEVQPGNLSLF
ncbi:uncharacterized protein [Ptychodera flava]|uniref:uncharacterized protein n=1 Tax=Ptychodera flava TaxID=63121 RepID=UPI00396A9018